MADERFDYLLPEQRDWWIAHAKIPPTLILRCGIDGCAERVGEVKTDKTDPDIAIALMYSRFGDRTVRPIGTTRSSFTDSARHPSG